MKQTHNTALTLQQQAIHVRTNMTTIGSAYNVAWEPFVSHSSGVIG